MEQLKLSDLQLNQSARIKNISGSGILRQHLLDMGIIENAIIEMVKYSPFKDPIQYKIHGYELSLRKDDASLVEVELVNTSIKENTEKCFLKHHPRYGENSATNKVLADNTKIIFGLIGNQNSGKTTLFNQLTGANQHVGNFPGVTVTRKSGSLRKHKNASVIDTPGIYSLSPYSKEELVTRDFLLHEKPMGIINVVDATSIERGLYLTLQLIQLNIPMVVALNMMDELNSNDGYIDINGLEEFLGVPCIGISASKNQGIDELIEHALHVVQYQEKPKIKQFYDKGFKNGALDRCVNSIGHIIEDHIIKQDLSQDFVLSKVIAKDKLIINQLKLDYQEVQAINLLICQMENDAKTDANQLIATMYYNYVLNATSQTVIKPKTLKEQKATSLVDKLLTGKYTAIPIFILIMYAIFMLTFNIIGPFLQDLVALLIEFLKENTITLLENLNVNHFIVSLIGDGIFEGVGSLLSFIPVILVLFVFLSLIEDSGYMARIAFVMDKPLRKIGLSGRSIVPVLIGFGCSVPAVMSSRTLPSSRDRKLTIILLSFMSCTAKLPIYTFFCQIFFKEHLALVVTTIYLSGIVIGIISTALFRKIALQGQAVPFVMELPTYRLPTLISTIRLIWDKMKDFLTKAFTIIFISTIVIYLLQNFDFRFNVVDDSSKSILASIGNYVSLLLKPIGLGSYEYVTSLITGFIAKESVMTSLTVIFNESEIANIMTTAQCISLLTFSLLYTPCMAAISAIKMELSKKWAVSIVISQCSIAYVFAFIAYQIALLF